MPMTMSASVVLTSLPRDAHQALADAEAVDTGKSMDYPSYAYLSDSSNVNLTMRSHGSLSSTSISANSQKPGLQNQCLAEVRDSRQVSEKEIGLQRYRFRVLLCQQCFCAGVG